MSQPRTAFVRRYVRPSTRLLKPRRRGHATEVVLGGTCFLAIPSASYTSFAVKTLKLSLWRMVGGGPATGGHDSEAPSNRPLERPGMNAAWRVKRASAGRSASSRYADKLRVTKSR